MERVLLEQEIYLICEAIIEKLRLHNQTLCVCESITAGGVASQLVRVSGASKVFLGGIIAYTDAIKHRIVGVEDSVLETCGAVSKPCVTQMAEKTRAMYQASYALALSGYAEPFTDANGVEHAPLCFIALDQEQSPVEVRSLSYTVPRRSAQLLCTYHALRLLHEALLS